MAQGQVVEDEVVRLPAELAEEMIAHCRAERPFEACGILASRRGIVKKVFAMSNASRSPLRYSLDPREQFSVYRTLDRNGLDLGAVFHSHTHTEAYPSPTDIRLASEDVPYLIVSLAEERVSIRAFRILKESWTDADGEVAEVGVSIIR
jgi:[CysO sulfur-carrier protein]-S-L-cysteine hydrolase